MKLSYWLVLFSVSLLLPSVAFAQPVNDVCEGAIDLPPFSRTFPCPLFDGRTETVMITGTTAGSTPSTPYTVCTDSGLMGTAGDVWYRFEAAGAVNDVTLNAPNFNAGSQILAFTGSSCPNLQQRRCAQDTDGTITTRVFALPGEPVYLLITGNSTDGTNESPFTLTVTSSAQCEDCLTQDDGVLDLNPRNPSGKYACGSTVNVCFTLNKFIGNQGGSVEWLHSVIPEFGPGWDTSSVVPTVLPPSCNGSGTWNYYPDGWTSCQTGESFDRGFAYESGQGYDSSCAPNAGDPGNNYGDGNTAAGQSCTDRRRPTVWCWDITVRDCPPGTNTTFDGEDLSIGVQVFSDAVSGSWTNRVCNETPTFESIACVVICNDEEPIATPTAQTCPDFDDGTVIVRPNGGMGGGTAYNITIRDTDGDAVYFCSACTGAQTVTDLPPGEYNVEAVNANTGCPRNTDFTIDPGTYPEGTPSFSLTCPSDGPITLTGMSSRTGTLVEYQWTFPDMTVTTTASPTLETADPALEGIYTLVVLVDGCPSAPAPIDVRYLASPTVTASQPRYCIGDFVTLTVNNATGPYIWFANGDMIPNTGRVISFTADAADAGTNVYEVEVVNGNCTGRFSVEFEITPAPDPRILYNNGDLMAVCQGDPLVLNAVQDDGSPFPFGWRFRWAGATSGSSTTYTVPNTNMPGDFTVSLNIRNPQGCESNIMVPYTVGAEPVATLDADDATICNEGSTQLCVNVTTGTAPYEFAWNFDPSITTRCITIDNMSSTTSGINVMVTDANGCSTTTNDAEVTVAPALTAPVFGDCDESDVSNITFTWSDVGATRYAVYAAIDGGAEMLLDNAVTGTSYTVSGVSPGQMVTFRVVPTLVINGVDCEGPEATQTCEVLNCFSPGWRYLPVGPVCLIDDPQNFSLTVSADQMGDISFTSTDLGLMNFPADPSNTTLIQLPALPAGVNTGTYSITAAHNSFDGVCTFDTTLTIDVVAPPVQDFTITDTEICQGGTTTFEYTSDATGLGFDWQVPMGAFIVSGDPSTPGPLTVRFDDAGTQTMTLVLSNAICGDVDVTRDVEVVAPLTPPTITCGPAGVLSVNFIWDDQPGADEYEISVDGGTPFRQTETSYQLSSLMDGQIVEISVTAIGSGVCGNSTASAQSCPAALCPTFAADYTGLVDSICLVNGDETIDLSTITVIGGSGNMAMLSFSGPGIAGTTFDAVAAGGSESGTTHTITIDYVEEGPCTYTTTFPLVVFERPTAFIIAASPVCVAEEAAVSVGSTNFVANDDITIDFDGGTSVDDGDPDDNTYLVTWDTPGTKVITATVISNISGCPSEVAMGTVEVTAPLETPVVTCASIDLTSITFEWGAVAGAEEYVITSSEGDMELVPATTTQFTINGLEPGTTVSITVTPRNSGPCPDATPGTVECTTSPCPDVTVVFDQDDTALCLDGTESPVSLSASLSDGSTPAGTITFSGPNVAPVGPGAEFDPIGLSAGDYEVYVDYDGPSICDSRDTLVISLLPPPMASITTTPLMECAGTAISVGLDGTPDPVVTYTWDWNGGIPTDLGGEQYEVSWNTPGAKTVTLTATSACSATASFTIDITPTLDAPAPTCSTQELDAVIFTWPAVAGATDGYQVSLNGGAFSPAQTMTSFRVDGLSPGESVTIAVRSVRSGTTCNFSPAISVTCSARSCPPVTLAPAAAQTIFCSDETTPVLLEANLSGDDGTGNLTWTGTGVVDNGDGTYSFDPQLSGTGIHVLTASYVQEVLCSYSEELTITVSQLPDATFTVSETVVCAGADVLVSLSTSPGSAMVATDFDGGTGIDNGDGTYALSFPDLGTYTVSITVTENGCTATATQDILAQEAASAGTAVGGTLELCISDAEPIELSTRLTGADPGGVWSVTSGVVPAADLNTMTGTLNRVNLTAGSYSFTYTIGGNSCPIDEEEVTITLLPPPLAEAGPDETLTCQMGMVTLNGSGSDTGDGYTFEWTSNDPGTVIMDPNQLMIEVAQPGTYTLRVTNPAGCSSTDSVVVDAALDAPVMEVQVSNLSCFEASDGAILVTSVTGGEAPFRYSIDGESRGAATLFSGLEAEEYTIRVTDANGCFSELTFDLSEPDELTIELRFPGDSTEVGFGDEIFITAGITGGNVIDTLIWQPDSLQNTPDGSSGIQFIARETQMISVTVVDELGCTATDRQMLLVRKDRPVYFPTAFSPNNDNTNDIYFIGGDIDVIEYLQDFEIYDRWGERVYSSNQVDNGTDASNEGRFLPNDPAFGWNGFHRGSLLNPQVFVYSVKVRFTDGETIVYKGDFVLMR